MGGAHEEQVLALATQVVAVDQVAVARRRVHAAPRERCDDMPLDGEREVTADLRGQRLRPRAGGDQHPVAPYV